MTRTVGPRATTGEAWLLSQFALLASCIECSRVFSDGEYSGVTDVEEGGVEEPPKVDLLKGEYISNSIQNHMNCRRNVSQLLLKVSDGRKRQVAPHRVADRHRKREVRAAVARTRPPTQARVHLPRAPPLASPTLPAPVARVWRRRSRSSLRSRHLRRRVTASRRNFRRRVARCAPRRQPQRWRLRPHRECPSASPTSSQTTSVSAC